MSDVYQRDYAFEFRKRGGEEITAADYPQIIREASWFSSAIADLLTMLDPSQLEMKNGSNLSSTLETIGELIINLNSEISSYAEGMEKSLEDAEEELEKATTFLDS